MKKIFLLSILLLCLSSVFADDKNGKNGSGHGLGSQGRVSGTTGGGHGLGSQGRGMGGEKGGSKQIFAANDKGDNNPNSANKYNRVVITRGNNKVNIVEDSAYYQNFTKRNGWFEGRGPKLTKDEASHLNCYYKFSKRNLAGHWTLMQAYDGYGRLTTNHNWSSYILNPSDDKDAGANKVWREKMQSECQIEMIGSADGTEVVQERSLDAMGNVVSAAIPTKTGPNTFLYSYIDSWGRPAYIRTDSLGNDLGYANFVEVTRDERGFEVLYRYTDRNGIPAKNADGAFMNKREYDDRGNQLKNMSLNILGNLMIDDFGNCGMEYTYDNKGNMLTALSHDANWKPMQHPDNSRSSLQDNTCGYWFEYDSWGREIERGYLDTLGNKCSNQFGAYRIIREYNSHGLQTHCISYDKNGNKCGMDSLGIAEYINEINEKGYFVSTQSFDSYGKPANNDEGYCKKTWTFNNDMELEETEYLVKNDSVGLKFHYERDLSGNELRVWPNDDLIRVDSVNSKGDETLTAFYSLSYSPKKWWGFHKRISTYAYEKNKRVLTQVWLDENDNPVDEENADGSTNGYTRSIIITDSIAHNETKFQYYYDYLKQAFVQVYDENMNIVLGQYDITPTGEHARVGWWDVLFYNAKVELDYNSRIKSFVVENEFGEPSYLSSTNSELIYHYQVSNNHGNYVKFDENGIEIPDSTMNELRSKLPQVFCVEVTDSLLANSYGIKNGDVLLSYGDWNCGRDLKEDVANYFYLETILQSKKNKKVTLLRHHPETTSSELVSIELPIGKTSELGFYPHKIYYTQIEKERLLSTCELEGFELIEFEEDRDTTIFIAIQEKGGLFESTFYYLPQYDVKDPSILLFAKESYRKGRDTWSLLKDPIEKWYKKDMFNPSFGGNTQLYLTQDLKEVKTVTKNDKGNRGLRIQPLRTSTKVYADIVKFYLNNNNIIPNETDSTINFQSVPIIHVENDGHFRANNFDGYFILLQFNRWRLGQDYDSLGKEIEDSREKEHSIAFIRLNADGSTISLGECYNKNFPPGLLGLNFQDYEIQENLYQDVLKQLKKIKKYK